MVLEQTTADTTSPLDHAAQRAVDRALSDLRRGEVVMVTGDKGAALLMLAAETVTIASVNHLAALSGTAPFLVLTGQRAQALGLSVPLEQPVRVAPPAGLTLDQIRDLSDPTRPVRVGLPGGINSIPGPTGTEGAATILAKIARLLPSVVAAPVPAGRGSTLDAVGFARRHDLLSVRVTDIVDYRRRSARSLVRVAEASVPLEDAERTRLVAFRPTDGGPEHLAIIIGDPAPGQPVLARLHSECFTGDLLGSLRCDCGPQLRGAIKEIATAGAGIVLYLAQEGRGIGLMNKLRAYRLQDGGLDTVDANTVLGFDADERVYLPAAFMLRQLGFGQVRLLTNNPDKMAQLAACGVEVVERVPHIFPANGHNEAYLRTKAQRSGHLF